jgi:LacI family transcriptional regulator
MKEKRRPSLKDIAAHVGVSTAAVSAVINNRTGSSIRVGPETRARILKGLEELGYAPNTAAQVLAGGRSRIIAVFTYEPIFPFAHHNFYYPFLLGMEREAENRHYDLLLMTSCTDNEGRRSIYQNGVNRLRLADAAVLLGLRKNTQEISKLLRENFPVVTIGHREFPGHEASYVAAAYTEATAAIVERIAARGHRNIAMIRVEEESEPGNDRQEGFTAGCRRTGIDGSAIFRTSPERMSRSFVDSLMEKGITAVVCERFALAEAIAAVLEQSGQSVPEDLSIAVLGGPVNGPFAGSTDSDAVFSGRDWMTLQVPSQNMGIEAIRLVLELLDNPEKAPLRTTLPCPIVEGSTVRMLH